MIRQNLPVRGGRSIAPGVAGGPVRSARRAGREGAQHVPEWVSGGVYRGHSAAPPCFALAPECSGDSGAAPRLALVPVLTGPVHPAGVAGRGSRVGLAVTFEARG
uniref:Uncharacterized protein n=1 Tax=Streptomyces rochei TaxID=1928 RepID=A0A068Q5P5_STRRO|nr:hypothetical protein [Streptomyces rochei]